MSELKVTTIEELKKYSMGTVVPLPPFSEGQPFYARLRRPSMMALVKGGKIPNSLITKANELFANRATTSAAVSDENMMGDMLGVFDVLCEATFCEPKYKDIKEAGITLTDEQYMFIFNYSQQGVKALESFRTEQQN